MQQYLILKICMKTIMKINSWQGTVPIQGQAILISDFELHILSKVSKTVGILAQAHNNV